MLPTEPNSSRWISEGFGAAPLTLVLRRRKARLSAKQPRRTTPARAFADAAAFWNILRGCCFTRAPRDPVGD